MDTAVLLAAGRGTRMGPLTENCPKPLLPVAGVPIIERILLGLSAAGLRRAIIVTGYRGEQIERALGDGDRLGLSIRFVRQESPEGTARALLLCRNLLADEPFVLGWGDILVDPDFYRELLEAYRRRPCDVLLAVNPVDDPWLGAAVSFDPDGRVTRLVEKPPRGSMASGWNNSGIFVFRSRVLDYARRLEASPRGEYELPQALAQMVEDGCDVRALPIRGFWSDIGTPEDLARASQAMGGR